ncbi:MAG: EAL domain-containing protein [Lachnospiraceae bacterium]|nr:EAL domain-containing protein [Lachnospiraceae bacterium]
MIKKAQKFVLITTIFLYIVFVVSTIAEVYFPIELFSTLTAFSAGTIILCCLEDMDDFFWASILLAIGIYSWAFADLIRFTKHYVLGEEPLSLLVRTLYLMPNYFFGLALTAYIIMKLKGRRRELSYLLANTFCLSGIEFVLSRKMLHYISRGATLSFSTEIRVLLYFFINFFIIILTIHLFRLVGASSMRTGTALVPFGILAYIIFDFQYNYQEAIGKEPENIFTNLIYMLFLILIAVGILIQNNKKYRYFLAVSDFSAKAIKKRFILTAIGLTVNITLCIIHLLSLDEALYIVILLMAYLIMLYISRSDMLNEHLLEQQLKETEALEDMVEKKTHELKKANKYLERLSSTDLLTGLYNRRFGYEYLEKLHKECEENNGGYSVLCIDLNQFKPINDTYGHEMGDKVLKEFGGRMLALPDKFTAVRTGGDEFMLIMRNDNDMDSPDYKLYIEQDAFSIQRMFHTPIILDTYVFHLSASIGVATYPDDSTDMATLIQYADSAMYTIKHSSQKDGYCLFDSSLVKDANKDKELKEKLAHADPERDFELRYQPQYDVNEGTVVGVGVEVFPHLSSGEDDISPATLIPLAEELGLMNSLGTWLTKTSMKQIISWQEELNKELTLTINLSPLQIIDDDYIRFLENIGREYGIEYSRVTLDIDNEVIMSSVASSKATIKRLHEKGFKLSLNNFGGGDINLSYVLDCGFDGLKLSPSLVANANKPETMKLIKSIIAIAKSFNIEVTAVGIESDEQAKRMQSLGITKMQGYHFGKPTTVKEFVL